MFERINASPMAGALGAGDVLGDLIDSGVTAVVRLQTIFRQAAGSLIIVDRATAANFWLAAEGAETDALRYQYARQAYQALRRAVAAIMDGTARRMTR